MGKYVSPSLRYLGYTLATVIIILAILVQSARLLAPGIDRLRPNIERYLSEQLNAQVSIAALDANWYALRPHVLVDNLSVVDAQGEELFVVDRADLTLSLLGSLYNLQWTWKRVAFDGVTLKVVEGADQQWSIAGFKASSDKHNGRRWRYYDPSDLFTITQDVRLTAAKVTFIFANQRRLETSIPSVLIENYRGFHRLTASANVDNQQVFSLVIEKNEALLKQGLNAIGFLQFKDFPVERIAQSIAASTSKTASTTAQKAVAQAAGVTQQSTVDLSLWLDFNQKNTVQALGDIFLSGVSTSLFGQKNFLNIPLSANIRAAFDASQGWELGLRDVLLDNTQAIEQLKLKQAVGGNVEVALDHVDVASWMVWLKQQVLLPMDTEQTKKIVSILDIVEPNGAIDNLLFSFDSDHWQHSFLAANIDNLSLAPWRGIPGFRNINGYIESTLEQGLVNLSSQNFHIFPEVIYDAPIVFDAVESQIAWHINRSENSIIVNSNNIHAQGAFGRANSYFLLDVPIKRQSRPAHLDLHIGLQNSNIQYQTQLTPNRLPETLREWLSTSITEGDIEQAGFIYRGGLSKDQPKTMQLFFDVDNARVNYSDEWPAIDAINGQVVIDNQYVAVTGRSAAIAGNSIKNIDIVWPGDDRKRLDVQAGGQFSVASALQLLGKGWLGDKLGGTFSSWDGDGNIGIDLDLNLPIPLAGNTPQQTLDITFNNNDFLLKQQKINLQSVNGKMQFSSERGLLANDLKATLFDQPIALTIKQVFNSASQVSGSTAIGSANDDEYISITGDSQIAADHLSDWLLQLNDNLDAPKKNIVQGIIPYSMALNIPTSQNKKHIAALQFTSDLRGASIALPQPYGKSVEQVMSLEVDTVIKPTSTTYQLRLGESIVVNALSTDNSQKGFVAINRAEPSINRIADNTFAVYANINKVSLEPFLAATSHYWPATKQQQGANLGLNYDVLINDFFYKDTHLENFAIKGIRNNEAWILGAESHLFLGDIVIPHQQVTPIEANLKYLHLPKKSFLDKSEAGLVNKDATGDIVKKDPWASLDLSALRSANVAIDELRYGDNVLGNWRFAVKPVDGGVAFDNIYASASGLLLKGKDSDDAQVKNPGAKLLWLQGNADSQPKTSFRGALKGGDIKRLFDDLALPPLLESQSSKLDLNVAWSGSPAVFAIEKLQGELSVDLKKGRFLQNENQSGTGALPLLGLFNFDTLLRRVRLDFSDLYKKGVVFDRVTSRFEFDREWVYFKEPLLVTSPSSTFNVAGKINYPNREVDAILVATLPVSGNLTFITALAAGLPAAAGVYIVSKIFSPQVDKASSLNYSITGSWDKPKVSFIKLFGNQAEGDSDQQPVELIPFDDQSID